MTKRIFQAAEYAAEVRANGLSCGLTSRDDKGLAFRFEWRQPATVEEADNVLLMLAFAQRWIVEQRQNLASIPTPTPEPER